jgi:hypothetical protein
MHLLILHTLGVLTKPDRIEAGEEQKWLAFIRGEAETLSKGWFCVKQPSPSELEERLSWTEARLREREFFSTRQPWASQSLALRRHFGTAHLTSRLSEILSDLIQTRWVLSFSLCVLHLPGLERNFCLCLACRHSSTRFTVSLSLQSKA